MNPYLQFVREFARLAHDGKALPLGGFPDCPRPVPAPGAPQALIFSPHPDDEVIIGGLALRLMREAGWRVVNVAVTQGSNKARQAERLEELKRCCQCIGFALVTTAPGGLERVNPGTRQADPAHWRNGVDVIARILDQQRPRAVFLPHELDWNSSHIGTHFLVLDALRQLGPGFTCYAVETEFWGQMPSPNLMVESSPEDLADLITALTFHVGEVKRNPYHLTLPAWMSDNVRRGSELVGGQGGAAPGFTFATLYRLRRWNGSELCEVLDKGTFLGAGDSPARLFS
jgi:LmbE family N-acetylglucosaminyl deacetylase